MWKTKKLQASTLIEIIMVMVLVGIISSLAFSSLGIFAKNFEFFRRVTYRNQELTLLQKLIIKDMFKAQIVESNGTDKVVCLSPQQTISYEFLRDKILRHAVAVDTFHVNTTGFNCKYLQNSSQVLEKLSFDIVIEDQNIPYIFTKKYAADVFINQDQNHDTIEY